MNKPYIILPTYNEKQNVARLVDKLFSLPLPNLSVLVVDDNSPDGTAAIVERLKPQFPSLHLQVRSRKDGLGKAYVDGFSTAIELGATELVQMDCDFSHDPSDVPRLLDQLVDVDLVVGSRYCRGISVINWPLRRLLLSIGGNHYAKIVTGLPFHDVTGGFRAWRASALQQIDLRRLNVGGYGFQVAMLYQSWKKGHRIKEIPIVFTERREGQSKMSKSIIWEAIVLVWKLRLFG